MKKLTQQAFIGSVVIHLVLLVSAILVGWIASQKKEPEPLAFELVPSTAPTPSESIEDSDDNTIPEPDPIRVDELDPVREIPEIPKPKPTEPAQESPQPQPKISYEEWAKNRNLPNRVQTTTQPKRTVTPVERIQTDLRQRLNKVVSPIQITGVNRLAPVNTNALQAFLARLRESIQSEFNPAKSGLSADTQFKVDSNGRIFDAEIIRSSGNSDFDQSVIDAFRRTRTVGPPPGNQQFTFELTFRGDS